MTPAEVGRALGRRWVVLLALLLVTGAAVLAVPQTGVYWTRIAVVFLPTAVPKRSGNILQGPDPNLVYFAAAVERSVAGTRQVPNLSSSAATLYGTGVRRGFSLALVNTGGQWQSNYNRPTIVIEVVDSTAAGVLSEAGELVAAVQTTAAGMQQAAGVSAQEIVRTELAPAAPEATWVGGNQKRAWAAGTALAVTISVLATVLLDRRLSRRRR